MSALEKRRAEVPDEVRAVPAPAGARAEDRGADLARARRDDPRRAARGGRAAARADAPGARREERGADPRGAREGVRARSRSGAACSASGCRSCARSSRRSARIPAAVEVSGAGSVRRGRETFRDLDVIATATDPAALIAHFVTLPWVLEVAAHGDTKATVVTKQGLRLDLRVVPPEDYGSLLQHFTGSKDHNVALREEAQRRGLSISEYGVTVVETGEVHRVRGRGRAVPLPRLRARSRPSCARTPASSRRRATAGCRRSSRCRTSSASSTATRPGRRTARRRSRRWRAPPGRSATASWRSPTTRTTCARGGWRRSGGRSTRSTRASSRSGC